MERRGMRRPFRRRRRGVESFKSSACAVGVGGGVGVKGKGVRYCGLAVGSIFFLSLFLFFFLTDLVLGEEFGQDLGDPGVSAGQWQNRGQKDNE